MITRNDLNRDLLRAEYAVRGPIPARAQELEAQGRKIIYCNIGNPLAFPAQRPLTYLRQILSLLEYPALLDDPAAARLFPADVVRRVRAILERHPPGTGAYSVSAGLPFIRQAVADFIARRDGIPADKEHVILTDGASKGVEAAIVALIRDRHDGILIPIPQYPLYSAEIALRGGKAIGYYLDEAHHWQLREDSLASAVARARAEGVHPVAIAVINPGNPTGAVLTRENIAMVIRFARANGLAVLADEVYQENVYAADRRFYSFARVMHDLGETSVSLFSFHSVSKGFLGECGHRGGYVEFRNIPDDVLAELVKLQSISLCAGLVGQVAVYVMVAPPQPGEPSHARYVEERAAILDALKAKAEVLSRGINAIPGMSLESPQGALYGFVRFELPAEPGVDPAAMGEEARREYEAKRDNGYCLALLEETGICVVPGSGFGQEPGTLHFRTTFLPSQEEIEALVERLKAFHERYVDALAGNGKAAAARR
ncbi:MAG TPA: aminotransferase class I/II-fold pyridoxal phosphate-dependent enzyme [Gemmatimonadales bacterium]|nr:aminotransferase class I/II-fold pyridoxal phosphate-dependent enzyme [Gemmatimonadales bacterium]